MKAPGRSTIQYVYAKLKIEVIQFLKSEIDFNHQSDGEVYGFDAEEMKLYDIFCNDMIRAIEESEINYNALVEAYESEDEEPPF